jgi:hypothetical protein
MIKNIGLLHYLSSDTYKKICNVLNVDVSDHKTKENYVAYKNKPIFHINPFNIVYKQFGHIWFLHIYIDFPKLKCNYTDFKDKLFEQYKELFGNNIMNDFPAFDQIICDYVEFYNILKIVGNENIEENIKILECPPVQLNLDLSDLTNNNKPHGVIELSISKKDNKNMETLVRCFGTGLKKRIKDKSLHGPVGIKISKIVNKQTEAEIVNWVLKRHNLKIQLSEK